MMHWVAEVEISAACDMVRVGLKLLCGSATSECFRFCCGDSCAAPRSEDVSRVYMSYISLLCGFQFAACTLWSFDNAKEDHHFL